MSSLGELSISYSEEPDSVAGLAPKFELFVVIIITYSCNTVVSVSNQRAKLIYGFNFLERNGCCCSPTACCRPIRRYPLSAAATANPFRALRRRSVALGRGHRSSLFSRAATADEFQVYYATMLRELSISSRGTAAVSDDLISQFSSVTRIFIVLLSSVTLFHTSGETTGALEGAEVPPIYI